MQQRIVTLDAPDGSLLIDASTRETDVSREYWLLEDGPKGWDGGTAPKGGLDERSREGLFFERRFHGGRQLELRVRVHLASYDEAVWERRRLSAGLADGELGLITVEAPGLNPRSAAVQRSGEVLLARVAPTTFDYSIPLLAPDPRKYGPWRETMLRPVMAGVGLRYPLLAPTGVVSFGTAIDTAEFIWNDGNYPALPAFEVVGSFPGGVRIAFADGVAEYARPTYPQSPVRIDMAGKVTVNGQDHTSQLTVRRWASVAPGAIESPRLEPLQGGTGWCIAHHRDVDM